MERETEDDVLASLEKMAGSRTLAKTIKQSLSGLAEGAAGPELAELAREVLTGRTELSSLRASNAYADQLRTALAGFHDWYRKLSPGEREQVAVEARRQLEDD